MKKVLLLIPLLGLAAMSTVSDLRAGQPTSITAKCVKHKENLVEGKCQTCEKESRKTRDKLGENN